MHESQQIKQSNMKKQFFIITISALCALTTGCTREYMEEVEHAISEQVDKNNKATAYMTAAFLLSTPPNSAKESAADKQDLNNPEFNHVGTWVGKDWIENATVIVFNGTADDATFEKKQDYQHNQLTVERVDGKNTKVKTKEAFQISTGAKTVFMVCNSNTTTTTYLDEKLVQGLTLKDFRNAVLSLPAGQASVYTTEQGNVADDIAEEVTKEGQSYDQILLTGETDAITIKPGISKDKAERFEDNIAKMNIQRAVARVVVTGPSSFQIRAKNPTTKLEEENALTISELTYVVAQGEKKLYLTQQANSDVKKNGAAFTTPAFDQIPQIAPFWTPEFREDYKKVGAFYDYSGLLKNTAGYDHNQGIKVEAKDYVDTYDLRGEFVLPTLHKYVDRNEFFALDKTGYRKGNTAYVLVRGYLKPKYWIDENGAVAEGALDDNVTDLYLGDNGVFYVNQDHVRDILKHGVGGQSARLFKNRQVLYWVWLNPDNMAKPVNSPVIRNNIYHINIKSIDRLGGNWNPLVPDGINNPNPFPNDNPFEPKTPPVDPGDPLHVGKPWIRVESWDVFSVGKAL